MDIASRPSNRSFAAFFAIELQPKDRILVAVDEREPFERLPAERVITSELA